MEAIYYEVNIGLLTLELASNFESMAKSLNLEYRIEIPENFDKMLEKKVFVDLDMYEKIIFNLCKCLYLIFLFDSSCLFLYYIYVYLLIIGSNAFKHTWTGNVTVKLSVKWVENKEVIVLEVSDTGLFNLFFRTLLNIFNAQLILFCIRCGNSEGRNPKTLPKILSNRITPIS